jgi:glycosyltransferase involved in cell wall biosynthesis
MIGASMRMRLAILTSRTIPHHEADVEQTVQTAAALAARDDLDTVLVFASPSAAGAPDISARIEREYGVRLDASRLRPCRPWVDAPSAVLAITRGRASGPQMMSDAAMAGPVTGVLSRIRPQAVLTRRWPLAMVASRFGIPTVFETHSPNSATRLCRLGRAAGWRGIVVHSDRAGAAFVAAGWPLAGVRVIRNGHDPALCTGDSQKARARASLGLPLDAPVVCYAGRLNSKKDPESLVRTAAAIPEVVVVLVGACGDRERAQLESLAATWGACNVRVTPRVSPSQVATYLAASDVLLLAPTERPLDSGRTVLPLKTFLYLGAGRPIVGPATPDICEVLEHGRNAWLVPTAEPADAAAAVRLVLGDARLAAHLSSEARADAASFTWTARAERLVEFIRERCSDRRPAGLLG